MRYFRNKERIQEQDPECLWHLDEYTARLVLVDDDQYISEPYIEGDPRFYEVEPPLL